MRACLPTFLCCLVLSTLHAQDTAKTDAPTRPEWEPVEEAIRQGSPEAVAMLARITERFPSWPDGFVKYATELEKRGDYEEGIAAARTAYELAPDRADAADLLLRLLNRAGRPAEGLEVLASWGGKPDREGWIHFHAAEAKLLLDEPTAAERLLDRAMTSRAKTPPPEFFFLKGRILSVKNDLIGAINNFSRGIKDEPGYADHWYKLGLLQRRLALRKHDEKMLGEALTSFFKAAAHLPEEPQVIAALGQTRLDAGRYEKAIEALTTAIRLARQQPPDAARFIAELQAGLGLALLKRAEKNNDFATYNEAISHLDQAISAGLEDPAAINNRLAAVVGAQRVAPSEEERQRLVAKAEQILSGDGAEHIAPLNMAMQYYASARTNRDENPARALQQGRQALRLMDTAAEDLAEDPGLRGRFHLYRGHILALIAECEDQEIGREDFAADMRAACASYRQAGDLRTYVGREHYLYRMNQIDDAAGYEAGWQYLRWHNFLTLRGWASLLGNYGGSSAWRQPHHILIWAILLVICLGLGAKNLLFPKAIPIDRPERARKPPSQQRNKAAVASNRKGGGTNGRKGATGSSRGQGPNPTSEKPTRRVDAPAADARRLKDSDRETRPAGPPRPKRKAPGLSDRGAAIDGVARRVAKDREDRQDQQRKPADPRRRRR